MAQSISIGAVYETSANSFRGSASEQASSIRGFRAGVLLNFAPIESFSIEPQFLLSKKGASISYPENGSTQLIEVNYAEVPILFNLRIPLGGALYPTVFAGPYGAYLINSSSDFTYDNSPEDNEASEEVNFKKFDSGFIVGAGVDLQLERFFISLNGQYGFGAARIDNSELALDLKNSSYSINLGLGFVISN